jgi:nitroreductase
MLDVLKKRRSIRKYKSDQIEKEKIDILIKAALLSPSAKDIKPWKFIVVTDKELIEKLSFSKEGGSQFLKGAPLGIVVLAETSKSDVWIEDTSISSIIVQLAAESIGLSTCWIQIRERRQSSEKTSDQYVKEVLGIPDSCSIESIIAVGYPDEYLPAHTEDELLYDKVYSNGYGPGYTVG